MGYWLLAIGGWLLAIVFWAMSLTHKPLLFDPRLTSLLPIPERTERAEYPTC
jgi:hypothetical protein